MTDAPAPSYADLMRLLLSRGTVPDTVTEVIAMVERMVAATTRSSGSAEDRRRYERDRKAAYRAGLAEMSPGHGVETISTKPLVKKVEVKKEKNRVPNVPGHDEPDDGWPTDHLDQFWQAFPPFRRESKRKVGEKLARIRADRKATWEIIIGAARRYAATDPGKFACAPMVWLNGERWDREFGSTGGSNETARNGNSSRGGFSNIAARIRHGIPDAERDAGQQHAAGSESGHGPRYPE